jgi:hypothetical protein
VRALMSQMCNQFAQSRGRGLEAPLRDCRHILVPAHQALLAVRDVLDKGRGRVGVP